MEEHNIFIRKIPKEISSKGLEESYSSFGPVLSCKVSIDENYKSRGYGFVCFVNPEEAKKALDAKKDSDSFCSVKFDTKKKSDSRKAFNTIYVKDVPAEHDSLEGVKKLFAPFGENASYFHIPT
jgi:polyadenylate-binding protein